MTRFHYRSCDPVRDISCSDTINDDQMEVRSVEAVISAIDHIFHKKLAIGPNYNHWEVSRAYVDHDAFWSDHYPVVVDYVVAVSRDPVIVSLDDFPPESSVGRTETFKIRYAGGNEPFSTNLVLNVRCVMGSSPFD